jgi:1-acyl-sn-glycerol-3-phosphate acyltransferase
MLRQLIALVILIIWYVYISFGILSPLIFINKHEELLKIFEETYQILSYYALKYGFQSQTYYTNKVETLPNKVNIVIGNHAGTIDTFIILAFLKYCNDEETHKSKWIALAKKELIYFPGLGLSFNFGKHVKVARNWDEDKLQISKQLDKITEGTFFIFPEGTRFDEKKFKEGQQYSIENGFPVYDNLLVPKTKGLWTIYKYLEEKNKLGNIYDISIVIPKYLGKKALTKELIFDPMGNIFLITRKLIFPNFDEILDFKMWFLKEWKIKDNLIKMHEKIIYQKMKQKPNKLALTENLLFFGLVTYGLITQKYVRYYYMGSMGLAYILTILKS